MAAKAPVKKNLSAIKRARQAEKRNTRNRVERSKIKSALKVVETAVKGGDKEAAASVLLSAAKLISSARSKGILHKNNAARKISKLTRKVNAVSKA
ncbi:MAG TPA: 30S ribosomal protein S20 [Candidatus Sulfobium mesophilum]|nr:30S ribosomal protein S20 [Candidatus Sulfobium mesophilum]